MRPLNGFRIGLPALVAGLGIATACWAVSPGPDVSPPAAPPSCEDVLGCQLPREIARSDHFLRSRKYGLPITLDPRPLGHSLEVLRLNVMSQAMGYLNLYRSTGLNRYRVEASDRVEYLLRLGDAALGNGPRDGMYGYLMFDAYEILGDPRCLDAGQRAAARCQSGVSETDLSMNAGLMCALNNAYAARLRGDLAGGSLADAIVDRTAPKQFDDGAFPHMPLVAAGRNLNYTSWMATEMLLLRDLRPANELTEILLVNDLRFLQQHVAEDGSLLYSDSSGSCANDPGNADPRFVTSELASVALNLAVSGYRAEAARTLSYLFRWRMGGKDLGGYPDKHASVDSTNVWETGRPSILRTSLIFWFLTLIQRFDGPCTGPLGACEAVGADCPPLYRQLGLCDRGLLGVRSCIGGRATRCFDPTVTGMRSRRFCSWHLFCADENGSACSYACPVLGSKLCVGLDCLDRCQDPEEATNECDVECAPGQACVEPMGRPLSGASATLPPAPSGAEHEPAPYGADVVMSPELRRENLSVQVLNVRSDPARSDGQLSVELRLNHHGTLRVPMAELVLSTAEGQVLARRGFALEAGVSTPIVVGVPNTDSIVARISTHGWLREADLLDNEARVSSAAVADPADELASPIAEMPHFPSDLSVRGGTRLVVTLEVATSVELALYDVAGRLVCRLWNGLLPAGTRSFDWDLRTESRVRAEPGVYFVRLRTPSHTTIRRLVIVPS